jgi:hypothetical protein
MSGFPYKEIWVDHLKTGYEVRRSLRKSREQQKTRHVNNKIVKNGKFLDPENVSHYQRTLLYTIWLSPKKYVTVFSNPHDPN